MKLLRHKADYNDKPWLIVSQRDTVFSRV